MNTINPGQVMMLGNMGVTEITLTDQAFHAFVDSLNDKGGQVEDDCNLINWFGVVISKAQIVH
jgi:hypothetical protein